jgi:hypothetical protein
MPDVMGVNAPMTESEERERRARVMRDTRLMESGRQAFRIFAHSARHCLRYFRTPDGEQFLADVLEACTTRRTEFASEKKLWRAQLGSARKENVVTPLIDGLELIGSAEVPLPSGRMKPLPVNWGSEGRANPRGISYLYLATNQNTALAEVRPWLAASVSIGEFSIVRDLALIDCSKYHTGIRAVLGPDRSVTREDGIWSAIDEAFAKPVGRTDDVADYVPTQILSELFKANGYDGIVYKSLLDEEGRNVALFNMDNAELRSCSLLRVSDIKFDYADQGCTYYTGGKPTSPSD